MFHPAARPSRIRSLPRRRVRRMADLRADRQRRRRLQRAFVLSLLASALAMHCSREVTAHGGARSSPVPCGGSGRTTSRISATSAAGDVCDAAGRPGAASAGGAAPWRAALTLGAAGASRRRPRSTTASSAPSARRVSLVSLVVATGGRRHGEGGAARRAGGASSARSWWCRSSGPTSRCRSGGLQPATCSRRRGTGDAGELCQRAGGQRRLRPDRLAAATDRGAEHELFPGLVVTALALYGVIVARRRGSGPLAAAAAATSWRASSCRSARRRPRGLRHAAWLGLRLPGDPRAGALRRAGRVRPRHVGSRRRPRADRRTAATWWGVACSRWSPSSTTGTAHVTPAPRTGTAVTAWLRDALARARSSTCRWAATSRTRR